MHQNRCELRGKGKGIRGQLGNDLYGDTSGIKGDITGVYGCATGIVLDLDQCNLSEGERIIGVNIRALAGKGECVHCSGQA